MAIPFSDKATGKILAYLDECQESIYRCRNATTLTALVRRWDNFLIAAGRVIHAIEGECSNSPQGRQWYGGKRRAARNDRFLQYMYQARNIAEHQPDTDVIDKRSLNVTLEDMIVEVSSSFLIGPQGLVNFENDGVSFHSDISNALQSGGSISIQDGPKISAFLKDKRSNIFWLPTGYNGSRIDPYNIVEVAELYFDYLQKLFLDIPR